MILVDTSIWIDHLRRADPALGDLLEAGEVLAHPLIVAELALGTLPNRAAVLTAFDDMPMGATVSFDELRHFIDTCALAGSGIGVVDAALLAACQLAPGTRLWTRDKRLAQAALRLGLCHIHPDPKSPM